jgi:disulfide bond formation protein DsbB
MAIYIPIVSEFKSTGIDKAKKEFQSLEGAGAKTGFALKKAFLPATAVVGALAAGLFDAAKGAIEDEAASKELARSLRQTAGATDAVIASTENWITEQGKLLGVTDSELRPALSKLTRATGDVEESQRLANKAMDIAVATGKPLGTVTDALTKALGGNMTALGKLAPELREMVKEGASFDDIMAEMAITMGGAATEAANTAEGRFKRLGVALGETKESIGSALLPVIEAILPIVEKFAKWAQDNPTAFMIIAGAIGAIALSIMAINFAMALNPFTAIAMGVIALIALIIGAYKRFESFRNIVDAVFGAIKWWVTNVTIPIVESLLGVFKTVFNGIAKIWNNTVGKISFEIPSWVPGVGGKGFDMPNIPMLAQGGIVTSPTLALIGEGRGPEAVIPLNRMNEFTGGGGNNVTINVQGADPNAVVDALRTYMFRNGTVPIRIAG